ncbi:uncharacterized protein LOC120725845 isoform X4 [Simochromis diagramma]|uniref:uncharacterized protein LOC120725845 isoform X4 n=1 Tax=Simochromis diagramma TaxID=43689 RepID=UPI001A7E8E85|nr:uncharacterized protein LOC120725845 isoform X4 [Simochromis diagramma]
MHQMLPLWTKGPEPGVDTFTSNKTSAGSSIENKSTAGKASLACSAVQPTAPPPYEDETELIVAAAAACKQRQRFDPTSLKDSDKKPESHATGLSHLIEQDQEKQYIRREEELAEHRKREKLLKEECEELMKNNLDDYEEKLLHQAVSTIDTHMKRHDIVARGLEVAKEIPVTRTLIKTYLKGKKEKQSQNDKGPYANTRGNKQTDPKSSDVNDTYPFMIIGDQCCIQPPKISELVATIKELPDPLKNPTAFVSALQRSTRYHHLGGPDYRYILCQCIPGVTESQLIREIGELDPKYDKASTTAEFLWVNNDEVADFFKNLKKFLLTMSRDKIDLNAVTMCKQKPDESILVFIKRFMHCWTNEACMPEDGNDQIFITTFLNNIHPECSQLLKVTATDNLYELSKDAFLKLVQLKASADLFPTTTKAKSVKMMLNFDVQGSEESVKLMYAGLPAPAQQGSFRGRKDKSRDVCFCCGRVGHWSRECHFAATNRAHAPRPQNAVQVPATRRQRSSSSQGTASVSAGQLSRE